MIQPLDGFAKKLRRLATELEPEEGCSWVRCDLCAGTGYMPVDPDGKQDDCPDCHTLGSLKINWKEEADNRRIDDFFGK